MASSSDFISTSSREDQSKKTSEDAILAMMNDYMQQILRRKHTSSENTGSHPQLKRIWFYLNAPHSAIADIWGIDPARTRSLDDDPLPEDGLGNREFNTSHEDWDRYDYAYRVKSVRKLNAPLSLRAMGELYNEDCTKGLGVCAT
ncbi:hypothetical protein C8J55DRAFT_609668 [Lentinula edodes]|uniref:Uncharacterized protein n=1 Tax=Lentinula lateritia TaxID=40482 RepID=A0A9W8ZS73_9AGAR|nr:hypothetical protein C8J55DRAFT_609668 [Lentinula edodes]